MNSKEEFLQKREKWLIEVADQCHKYATEIDLDFYVFQNSSKIFNPDLLLIGINPGSSTTYTKALENIRINKNEDKRSSNNLDYEKNLFVESGGDWDDMENVRTRIKAIFHTEKLYKYVKNSVMMNMIYFNTTGSNDLKSLGREIEEYCITKTAEFVDFVQPKNIVFFTSDSTLLKKMGVKDIKQVGDFTKTGFLDGRQIIAIPHFSARGFSSTDVKNKIGDELVKFLK